MLRVTRREPVVVLLSADELALLTAKAERVGETPYQYAQSVFRVGLGVERPDEPHDQQSARSAARG